MKTIILTSVAVLVICTLAAAGPVLLSTHPDSLPARTQITELVDNTRYLTGTLGPVQGVMVRNEHGGWTGVLEPHVIAESWGTCDDDDDCQAKAEKMCDAANHGKKVKDVETTGSACFAKCDDGSGAVAFVFCEPAGTTGR